MLLSTTFPCMFWILLSCLMLQSWVQGEDFQLEQPSKRISCPSGSKAYDSHCYAVFLNAKTWMAANLACQKHPDGNLVSVLNSFEGSFVASLVKSTSTTYTNIWIGLYDPTQGSEPNAEGWVWSSRDLMTYQAWDSLPTGTNKLGYCGSLYQKTNYLKWKEIDCEQKLPYVCKFKN
ncbi:PREDICTED: regenerating islet-derived protein 3-gamma-like [Elephantulus edwardii]|uniref:regenerating islet-derived protein 3-gamma-like n=1 Tax=Elephantulus edwardii TaxID=28737 RepID=UPI0003F0AF7D|nr:PREDICTED: regenerating islet-derived protein 3-gamma-like [Elephantulus edwardii]